jgi:general secretion pathway protein G
MTHLSHLKKKFFIVVYGKQTVNFPGQKLMPMSHMGFTLVELAIVVAIAGLLSAIAIPNYIGYREKALIANVVTEIKILERKIGAFVAERDRLPDDLGDLGMAIPTDPWGNPYQYLNIADAANPARGAMRKDHFMVPVNSDYDLYSMGKDGRSVAPFTARASRDDIVRANNGGFVGPVSEF